MSRPEMQKLKTHIEFRRKSVNIYPAPAEVFNAFKLCPYDNIKVIIIGQDPYHSPNTAHGLAFSSLQKVTPPSLENIFREIYDELEPSVPFGDYFKSNNLTSWAQQGILLLNTVLTVEESKAKSHSKTELEKYPAYTGGFWESLTKHILLKLNDHPRRLIFMFWGRDAQGFGFFITNEKHLKLMTSHPSPYSVDQGFKGSGHFYQARDFIRHANNPDFVSLDDCFDKDKIKERVKEEMKKKGMKKEQWLSFCKPWNWETAGIYLKNNFTEDLNFQTL